MEKKKKIPEAGIYRYIYTFIMDHPVCICIERNIQKIKAMQIIYLLSVNTCLQDKQVKGMGTLCISYKTQNLFILLAKIEDQKLCFLI